MKLAEPVAYVNLDEKRLEWAAPFNFKSSCFVLGKLPLYFHPPKCAEKEAESFCDSNCTWLDHHPQCIRAEPEAEPVAWVHYRGDEEELHFDPLIPNDIAMGWNQYPLYTRPEPTRKPMTEEEILELYNQCEEETSVHSTIFHFDKFARAIEARGKVLHPLKRHEIEKAFVDSGYLTGDSRQTCFIKGIRFAEKHHGIGGEDE